MGIQKITYFPLGTVPECAEYGNQIDLLAAKTYPVRPRGTEVVAFHSSFNAWGRFRYLWTRKKQTQKGVPVAYSAGAIVSRAGSAVNSKRRAGIMMAAASASQLAWVQVEGVCFQRAVTDTGIVAGDTCIKDEVTAGMLDTATNTGTQSAWVLGVALKDDSGSFMAPGQFVVHCA